MHRTLIVNTPLSIGMGVGAAERVNKVRWGVAGEIAIAWLVTIPSTALVGGALSWVINLIMS